MKRLLATFTGILLSASVFAQSELPDTQIKDLNTGRKVAFNETVAPGKVTLINFWATWCVPCKKEINNMRDKLAGWQAETDFNYMTVSIDESRMEGLARSYAKAQGWGFPYYIDPNSDLKRSLNFQTVPYTMIIDKNGKVVYTHQGYEEGAENEVYQKVKEYSSK